MEEYKENFTLSPAAIDKMSIICARVLSEAEVGKKDILRIRLSLEEILGVWLERLGGVNARCETSRRFRRDIIEFSVEGPQLTPGSGDAMAEFFLTSRLLAGAGLALSYSYKNGANTLTLAPPKKLRFGLAARLFISLFAAIVSAFIVMALPDIFRRTAAAITTPLIETFISLMSAISSPFIFLSVCGAIIGIGDIAILGQIGKFFVKRTIRNIILLAPVVAVLYIFFFAAGKGARIAAGSSSGGVEKAMNTFLAAVPHDIITPFQTGNIMQLTILGIAAGIALLILGSKVSGIQQDIFMLEDIVTLLIDFITKLTPFLVFLSVFNLMVAGTGEILTNMAIIIIFCVICSIILVLFFIFTIALIFRVSPMILIKKFMPAFVLGLTTASQPATFTSCIETCEKQLGVKKSVAAFVIPFAANIYKPEITVCLLTSAMPLAMNFGVPITTSWLVTAVVSSVFCSMSPSMIAIIPIFFAQAGIPEEAVAVAIAVNPILNFIKTACGTSRMMYITILGAGSLGLLDKNILKREVKTQPKRNS
ncbi:MAG: cation:dicarboxylase symporter family transporter [Synergistes sp.]|nr:cation:dicarboxylase symporter family transporter [Synergistes sp.]